MRTKNSLLLAFQLGSAVAAALKPLPLLSSQIPKGEDYAGAPATGDALRPKVQFEPATVLMHGDSGNTGSTDAAGPLGRAPRARSAQQILGVMLWGPNGTLSGGRADLTNPAAPRIGLGAYDPDTLEALAEWFPENRTEYLSLGYMSQRLDDNMLLIAGLSGTIYLVQREDDGDAVTLALARQIDVSASIRDGETLLNSMFDAAGNVWFTSGRLPSTPLGRQSSATIGYVEPGGAVHALHLADQQIENGISVNGTTAYVVTGPLNGTACTVGYVHALTTAAPGDDDAGVATVWRAQYDAGSRPKDTALSRGGGATPALLGGDYVVTTDNADGQIHLIVLHQGARGDAAADQLHCRVPLFREGAGLNDIRPTVHFDGSGYGVVIINGYGQPEIQETAAAILNTNGAWNDMSGMAGGVQRVDVDADGCRLRWDIPLVTKSVPALSTATGLLYGYVQDTALAEEEGNYSWSFIALDWRTGKTVWKKRSGAGGTFNDNFYPGIVGGGKFYQSLMLGVTWVEDGDEEE